MKIETVLAGLRETKRGSGVFTIREMMDETGRTDKWCRQQMTSLIELGKAKFAGRVAATRIDGQPTTVPAYTLVKR